MKVLKVIKKLDDFSFQPYIEVTMRVDIEPLQDVIERGELEAVAPSIVDDLFSQIKNYKMYKAPVVSLDTTSELMTKVLERLGRNNKFVPSVVHGVCFNDNGIARTCSSRVSPETIPQHWIEDEASYMKDNIVIMLADFISSHKYVFLHSIQFLHDPSRELYRVMVRGVHL